MSYFLGIPRESYLVSSEEFEDTKVELVMNIRKLKKDRQHNGQKTEEQTTQWPKEKGQKDKQRSTKHTHKTKDRVTRTLLKARGELCNHRAVNSITTHGGGQNRCNIIIWFVIDFGQTGCFLPVLRFHLPIKLTATKSMNIVES